MDTVKSLPERLRQARLQRGLSQENMADTLGISTTAYGDLERGRTEMTLSRLAAIGTALEVGIPELLGIGNAPVEQENMRLGQENLELRFRVALLERRLAARVSEERERIGF